jgi:hypothetical protein
VWDVDGEVDGDVDGGSVLGKRPFSGVKSVFHTFDRFLDVLERISLH